MPTLPNRAQRQAKQMQEIAFNAVLDLRADMQESKDKLLRTRIATAISQLAKTWDTIEDRKRILKGKPMPGSLRPESKPSKKPKRHATNVIEIESPPKESLLSPEPTTEATGQGGSKVGEPI